MTIGTLAGYSMTAMFPIGLAGDHTYVADSIGRAWGCNGRSTGGNIVCSGQGNIDQANCLAQLDGKAGILWGTSGVCHQAANRILYAASPPLLVSQARAYGVSFFRYGAYGKEPRTRKAYSPTSNPWPELQLCQSSHSHP
jgi:hypothetical protein